MRNILLAAIVLSFGGMTQAQAQTQTHNHAATPLELSVTGTASRAPDAIAARLTMQSGASSAAAAQHGLNLMAARVLRAAHAIPGITATVSGYNVAPVYPKRISWQAQQTLELDMNAAPGSAAAKPLLGLVSQLQQDGLMLEDFSGTLSPLARHKARQAAIADAVQRLKEQAAAVAASLGDQPGAITALRLNVAPPVFPLLRAGPMAMAEAAPPSISAAPVAEHVTLSGTILLTRHSH